MGNLNDICRNIVGRSPRAGEWGLGWVLQGVGLALTLHLMAENPALLDSLMSPLKLPRAGPTSS